MPHPLSLEPAPTSPEVAGPRFHAWLLLLFVGSGCAALIYEIVWFQLLQLVIGSSAVSLAVLLGTFMGGMCIGSLAFPRFVARTRHPLRTYAGLEIGIAVFGLVVLWAMPAVGKLYLTLVGHGAPGIFLRALICVICLLPPTILMGATLPAVARWVEATPKGVSWLGLFYGGNTAGAVIGCLLAGFYLLRVYDNTIATYCAVVLNSVVAFAAVYIARRAPYDNPRVRASAQAVEAIEPGAPGSGFMLIAIGLSGLCALAAEVVWARVLSLFLGATVYTFSIILAVFLIGLGIGSSAGSLLARSAARPRFLLACCQLAQVAALAWAAHAIAVSLPSWPNPTSDSVGHFGKFAVDLLRCGWTMLPSTILWGASFPLALASMARPGQDSARLVGRAYAANTLGAILGAVLATLILIPTVGTQRTQVILIGLSVVSAGFALFPRRPTDFALLIGGAAAAVLFGAQLPAIPWQLVAYGRFVAGTEFGATPLYVGEGMNATVAVSQAGDARFFHVSGKTEASSLDKDMRLQRMLGHLPALLHPNPKSVLIVGCGAGVTAGTFTLYPSIERIVICDIEPLIPRVVAHYFREENHDVLRDPRVEIIYDDARHYIATTQEKFDVITSDPIHPWVKGSAVLYSEEYFQLCRERLQPGGLFTQWVPLYESNRAVVQSELATLFSVFPHASIWANDDEGFGYDTVVLGYAEPLTINLETLQKHLDHPSHDRIRTALNVLVFESSLDLLATYTGRAAELKEWLAAAEINRDRNLRLQYLAGLELESVTGAGTYDEMLAYRSFPYDVFQGSTGNRIRLQEKLGMDWFNPQPQR